MPSLDLTGIINSNYILKANTRLTDRAKTMSQQMTRPEQLLWFNVLQKRQLAGYKFIRQKQVFNYILDFYCSELLLAIEVDGTSHDRQMNYDQQRTSFLNTLHIKVIRISNDDVIKNLVGVRELLLREVALQ